MSDVEDAIEEVVEEKLEEVVEEVVEEEVEQEEEEAPVVVVIEEEAPPSPVEELNEALELDERIRNVVRSEIQSAMDNVVASVREEVNSLHALIPPTNPEPILQVETPKPEDDESPDTRHPYYKKRWGKKND